MKVKLDHVFQRLKNTNQPIDIPPCSITPRTTARKIACEIKDIVNVREVLNKGLQEKCDNQIVNLEQQRNATQDTFNELSQILQQYKDNKFLTKTITAINKDKNEAEATANLLNNKIQQVNDAVQKEIRSNYYNNSITYKTIYQENIEDAEKLDDQLPAVLHYGINTQLSESLVGAYLGKQDIHPIEFSLFKKAFNYLKNTESAQTFLKNADFRSYPNNAVLVDIFVRDDNNRIKQYENTDYPETHTVVLWRKKDNECYLIDPSQRSYSENFIVIMKNYKYVADYLKLLSNEKLYGTANYAPNDKPGYSNDPDNPLPRDCTDIAVKVAFELNEQQKLNNPLEGIEKNMLKQISNVTKNAPHLAKLTNVIIRELQSSNFETRTSAKKITEKVNNGLIKDKVIKNLDSNRIKNYSDIQTIDRSMNKLSKYYV